MRKQIQKILLASSVSLIAYSANAQEKKEAKAQAVGENVSNASIGNIVERAEDSNKAQTIYDLRPKFEGKVGEVITLKKGTTQVGVDLTELQGNPKAIQVLITNLQAALPNFKISRGNIYTDNFLLIFTNGVEQKSIALNRTNIEYNKIWAKIQEIGNEAAEEFFNKQVK